MYLLYSNNYIHMEDSQVVCISKDIKSLWDIIKDTYIDYWYDITYEIYKLPNEDLIIINDIINNSEYLIHSLEMEGELESIYDSVTKQYFATSKLEWKI